MNTLRLVLMLPLGLVMAAAASLPAPAPRLSAAACETLAATTLAATTITKVEAIAGGSFTPPGANQPVANLPPFCRVAGVIAPTADSHIRFEVWLPLQNWNGKFAGVGNGGWAGTISYGMLAAQIRRGYASGSTDTGHPAVAGIDMARFAFGHPEKLIDFGHRAVHEMTVASKALTAAFYGQDPRYSYFIGCSTGGRQALMEAQRYPEDYVGIVAGAPANNLTRKEAGALDAILAMNAEPGSYLPAPAIELLNRGVLEVCDALDGVKDGVLENPRACAFDPVALQCADGKAGDCLTSAQVRAARRIYAGLKHPTSGTQLYAGFARGGEVGWDRLLNPASPYAIPLSTFRWLVMGDSTWDWRNFDYSRPSDLEAFLASDRTHGPILNAFDADLSAFRRRGGKLLQYHGWADPTISPGNSVAYYEKVLAHFSGGQRDRGATADVQSFFRLFMVPGMGHCGGGPGPNVFDMQAALEEWVERDRAPESVIAVHRTNGQQDRSRPLCPFPKVAVYRGSEDTNNASNFACR